MPIEVSPQASPVEAQRRGSPDASRAVAKYTDAETVHPGQTVARAIEGLTTKSTKDTKKESPWRRSGDRQMGSPFKTDTSGGRCPPARGDKDFVSFVVSPA